MFGYFKKWFALAGVVLLVLMFQACSIKIPVESPKVSENSYTFTKKHPTVPVQFKSDLTKEHEVAVGDRTDVFILEHDGKKIDATDFIRSALKNEIAARKLPMEFVTASGDTLTLEHFEIISHRASGFSPMVTVSTLKLKMRVGDETKTLVSMVKRAKTPVWSMTEVYEPCYNEATTLLVKEIVAKINKAYVGYTLDDDTVASLEKKISSMEHGRSTYMDVYELGFSNNKSTLGFLKELTNSKDEYIRLAAISSLGILGNDAQFDFLVNLNKSAALWQDRAMALKSIGDLGTQESRDYLKERKAFWTGKTTDEAVWNLKIINLYLS